MEPVLVRIGSAEYPRLLLQCSDAPKIIYRLGRPLPSTDPIAVAGARDPSDAGIELARTVGRLLAKSNTPIVTGIARGVDQAASISAYEAGGFTVGVWPAVYKRQGAVDKTVAKFAEMGAVLAPSLYPRNFNAELAARSRLVACIGGALIIPEARYRTRGWGTIIAVRRALELNRMVVVVKPYADDEDVVRAYRVIINMGAVSADGPEDAVDLVLSSARRKI